MNDSKRMLVKKKEIANFLSKKKKLLPEEAGAHQDASDIEQGHATVDHVGVLHHPQQNHRQPLTWETIQTMTPWENTDTSITILI
jgi:hypothetical protein